MKLILTFFLSTFFSLIVFSQAPSVQWQKYLGGSGDETVKSAQQTTDGGYILAGRTESNDGDVTGNHGDSDFWIVKLTSTGNIEWQKTLGGTGRDLTQYVQQTSDGGYIVLGLSNSSNGDVKGNHGGYDFCVFKLNSKGIIEWQKSYGGSGDDLALTILQTTDGGYVMSGYTNSNDGDVSGNHGSYDAWIVKLNSTGVIQWQKCLGGSNLETANSMQQSSDGGYILGGYTNSNDGDVSGNHGGYDSWIIKLKSTGAIQWQKCYGGSNTETTYSVIQTKEGGYIFAGSSESRDGNVSGNHGASDFWVVKITNVGAIEWQKSIGGIESDTAHTIQQTKDGGYIVGGLSNSASGNVTNNYGDFDFWLVKINSLGAIEWQKSLGGIKYDVEFAAFQTSDGGYFTAGASYSNGSETNVVNEKSDIFVVKLGLATPISETSNTTKIKFYPNPTNNLLTIELIESIADEIVITNIEGRVVFQSNLFKGDKKKEIDVSNFPNGTMFISLIQNSKTILTEKFVVSK